MNIRKLIGQLIIISIALFAGYKYGYGIGADRVGDFTRKEFTIGAAVIRRDIMGGLPYAEDSAAAGILLSVHDYIAGCTADHGYIIPSDNCIKLYQEFTGDNPIIDWE